jgi:hypothetical protein
MSPLADVIPIESRRPAVAAPVRAPRPVVRSRFAMVLGFGLLATIVIGGLVSEVLDRPAVAGSVPVRTSAAPDDQRGDLDQRDYLLGCGVIRR